MDQINVVVLSITIFLVYILSKKVHKIEIRKLFIIFTTIASFIMALFMSFGISFREFGDLSVLTYSTGSMIKTFMFITAWTYIIYCAISLLVNGPLSFNFMNDNFFKVGNNDIPLLKFVVCLICFWMPYLIIFFPGTGNADTINQLAEFFNHGRFVIDIYPISHYLLNTDTYTITNQHNFFVTFFYGSCVKVGLFIFKNANIGIFLAAFMQMLGLAFVFSFSLKLVNENFSKKLTKIFFYWFALFPVFPIFSLFLVKNTIYTIVLIWFMLLLFEFVEDKKKITSKKWSFAVICSVLLQLVSEKYAIYVLIFIFFYMIIQFRKEWEKIIGLILIPVIVFKIMTSMVLFPILHVADGDPIEAYSVPIQQTALYVKEYPHDITKKELKILNRVFVVKNLANLYNPQLSDPVKSSGSKGEGFIEGYRYKSVTKKDFVDYKKIWVKMFFQHPIVYFTAFFNLNYGYLDLGYLQARTYANIPADSLPLVLPKSTVYSSQKGNKIIETNFHFHKVRKFIQNLFNVFSRIPPVSFVLNGNVYLWFVVLLLLATLFYREYRYIVVMVPLILQIPIIMLSPVNNNQRYLMPFIMASSVVMIMFMIIRKSRKKGD